ncbi:MAG: PAS domain S-box protein [Bacteroidota bacterium]|jgi:PAS domain S-box-containing protein
MSYQVLLVEERIPDAELIKEALRQSAVSCKVTHVRRLSDALEHSVNTHLDAVLLNLLLSDSQGLDTYVAMRNHASSIPIILLANAASHDITLEAMKRGAQDYLHIEEISPSILGKTLEYAIERKRHERDLRVQKEFYENLLKEANVWVEALDRQGKVLFWNKGAEKISGFTSESLVSNQRRWECLYPDDALRQEMFAQYETLLQNERGVRDFETEIRTARGEERVISWNSNVIRGNGNEIVGCMLVGNDVTERRRIRSNLLVTEQRYQLLAELTSDYVYSASIDEQGRSVTRWVEGAFECITGYDPEEIIGRPDAWAKILVEGDVPGREDFIRLLEKDPLVLEYRIRHKDGSIHWLRDSIRPIRDIQTGSVNSILGAIKDISAEKAAREAEIQAGLVLDALINSAHDYAFLVSPEGLIISAGPAIASFFGRTPEEMKGMTLFDFVSADFPEDRRERLHELCRTREAFEYTTEFNDHTIFVRGTPVLDARGDPVLVVVFGRDITEEQRAKIVLMRGEEKFRGIIENATDGIMLMDEHGKFIEWNPSMEQITGIPKQEALGSFSWDILFRLVTDEEKQSEGVDEGNKQRALSYLESGDTQWLNKLSQRWIQRPDGGRRCIEVVSFRVGSSFGMHTASVMRDITEIKLAEQRIEEKNQLLQGLVQAIPDMVYFKDTELRNIIANQAYADFIGLGTEELLGKTEMDFLPPDLARQCLESDQEVISSGVTVRREEFLTHPETGTQSWFETLKTPLVNDNGEVIGLIGVSRNITERKFEELKREEQNAELHERNEELDTFTHSVAHDLKNPLSLILGYADMVQFEGGGFTAQELNDYMGSILFNGRKMSSIINALLLLASVRKEEVVFSRIDMQQIVTDALRRLQKQIRDDEVIITLPEKWFSPRGYAPWIEEVWVNYIGNAIKYGKKGGAVRIEGEQSAKGMLRYSVIDEGPGIPKDKLEEIFLPFTRLAQAKIEGHGLGLSIVKRIVEKTGGQVSVTSEPGVGSTFSFTLPAAR